MKEYIERVVRDEETEEQISGSSKTEGNSGIYLHSAFYYRISVIYGEAVLPVAVYELL